MGSRPFRALSTFRAGRVYGMLGTFRAFSPSGFLGFSGVLKGV